MGRPSTSDPEPRRPGYGALLALTLLALPTGSLLAQEASRWSVTASGAWLSPAGGEVTFDRTSPAGQIERVTHRVDGDGTGFGVSLELRPTPRIGLELGLLVLDLDNDFEVASGGAVLSDTETMGVESVLVGADWHFAPGRRLDVSLGAFVAQTMFDDVIFLTEAGRREKLTFDDDHGFGVKLGLDLPLQASGRWFAAADVRSMVTILESEIAGRDMDLDPLIVTVGVGTRF